MADWTLSYSISVNDGAGNYVASKSYTTEDNFTTSPPRVAPGVQDIGTSNEAITVVDVSAPRLALFKNLDSTNFVQIGVRDGSSNFLAFLKLEAGESCPALLDGSQTYYAKADTASVRLEVLIWDD